MKNMLKYPRRILLVKPSTLCVLTVRKYLKSGVWCTYALSRCGLEVDDDMIKRQRLLEWCRPSEST